MKTRKYKGKKDKKQEIRYEMNKQRQNAELQYKKN